MSQKGSSWLLLVNTDWGGQAGKGPPGFILPGRHHLNETKQSVKENLRSM